MRAIVLSSVGVVLISLPALAQTSIKPNGSNDPTSGPPSITSVSPNSALQGQTVSVTITGKNTNFVNGVTQANFGPNISVGGAAPGANGVVGVTSATKATASLVINNSATLGGQNVTVVTGAQTATLANGFTVDEASVTLDASATPKTAQAGITTASVTGSGFPAGTIWAANVTVSLAPKSGGAAVTTTATVVTAGTG